MSSLAKGAFNIAYSPVRTAGDVLGVNKKRQRASQGGDKLSTLVNQEAMNRERLRAQKLFMRQSGFGLFGGASGHQQRERSSTLG